MKTSITEEMKFRQTDVEYAIKYDNNARAARRYETSRQQVQRWRKKYNGTVQSLANQSRRPHKHPKQHTEKEIKLIQNKYQRHKHEGLGQVYRKSIDAGYKRSYESMCRQIKKFKNYEKPKKISYPKSKYEPLKGSYPGEYVQIDVKNEHSSYETSKMLKTLEKDFGFKIKTIQTDNGREFCNDREQKKSLFEKVMKKLGIEYIRTRPYSPWQNGVAERSHKIDNELFYSRRRFRSEEEMYKSFERYRTRTNNIARRLIT